MEVNSHRRKLTAAHNRLTKDELTAKGEGMTFGMMGMASRFPRERVDVFPSVDLFWVPSICYTIRQYNTAQPKMLAETELTKPKTCKSGPACQPVC